VAVTEHGVAFASVVERGLVFGAQCHPEKSGAVGLALLRTFVSLAAPR
jgi:glutamine amidotransferase